MLTLDTLVPLSLPLDRGKDRRAITGRPRRSVVMGTPTREMNSDGQRSEGS